MSRLVADIDSLAKEIAEAISSVKALEAETKTLNDQILTKYFGPPTFGEHILTKDVKYALYGNAAPSSPKTQYLAMIRALESLKLAHMNTPTTIALDENGNAIEVTNFLHADAFQDIEQEFTDRHQLYLAKYKHFKTVNNPENRVRVLHFLHCLETELGQAAFSKLRRADILRRAESLTWRYPNLSYDFVKKQIIEHPTQSCKK